ncbi:MAG TPA: alpha/beta fold hydrolase [Solirubrobacteraceae bacterium]|nr:alpha/beta fold hydrolase [Solirubrobacteraceae bacterium]
MGAPLYAELRYWPELAGLLADGRFRSPARRSHRPPVLLIPGFMAGDASLTLLAGWLRRRGHTVRLSGIRLNAGCAGRDLTRLEQVVRGFGEPTIVIGQSRGGTLARALAARSPEAVAAVIMLGSPVLDPLAVSPSVMRTVRSVARLGDLGVPGVFSSQCRDGDCCTDYYALLRAPLTEGVTALMVYSRTDAIVDWRACLDPSATCVEIDGSHCGMAVNARVYAELERVLERAEERAPA